MRENDPGKIRTDDDDAIQPRPALPGAPTMLDVVREVVNGVASVRSVLPSPGAEDLTPEQSAQQLLAMEQELLALEEELQVLEEEVRTQQDELAAVTDAQLHDDELTGRLVSALPVALVSTDAMGTIVEANVAAASLIGKSPTRLHHKPIFVYVAPGDRRSARAALARVSNVQAPAELELTLTPHRRLPVRCHASLVASYRTAGLPSGRQRVRWVLVPETGPLTEHRRERLHALSELGRLGAGSGNLRKVLERVATLACDGVDGITDASVALGNPVEPELLASSSARAQLLDGVQYMAGGGPTFDAYAGRLPVNTAEMASDSRWPALKKRHQDMPAGSCIAFPLYVDDHVAGVLTLYGAPGGPVTADLVNQGRPFAQAAASLIRDSMIMEELRSTRDQLSQALTSRAVIDQAKGMVMLTRGCSADEAFRQLGRLSNNRGEKLREIAARIVADPGSGWWR